MNPVYVITFEDGSEFDHYSYIIGVSDSIEHAKILAEKDVDSSKYLSNRSTVIINEWVMNDLEGNGFELIGYVTKEGEIKWQTQ